MKRLAPLAISSIVALAACGTGATVQEQAGDAVATYVNDDNDLSDADFDTACVRRTALGLTDDIAQDIVDDEGRVDLDVDDDDRDDVYDFYNCADDDDLAQLVAEESGAVAASCLEAAFEADDPSDFLSDADTDRPGRLGDFDQVVDCAAGNIEVNRGPDTTSAETTAPPATVPETTVPPTTAPPTTAPPTTAPPTTAPPTTAPPTTAPPTTAPPATPAPTTPPAMEERPQPMSDPNTGAAGFAADAEDFLNNEQIVEDAVGGAIDNVFCIAPSNANVGTRFLCFGSAVNFGFIEFEIEITEPAAYLVQEFRESLSTDRILVFIVLDSGFIDADLPYDQICVRNFLANLPDDQVATVFDEDMSMMSIDGLVSCVL